jgi:SulP family sulfate permease
MKVLADVTPQDIASILLAGIIAGMVTLISSVSFAALIFNGTLSQYVSTGITIAISTAVIAGVIFSLLSSCRPVVAMPDDDTAPIVALMVTLVITSFPEGTSPQVQLVTALGTVACASLLTGVVLAALGIFRLGSLVRYLPYSVMGGYFAGAGLLLIQGSLRVVTDLPLMTATDFLDLFEADLLWRWVPALVSAMFIRLCVARLHQSIAVTLGMVILVVLFYLLSSLAGVSGSELMDGRWLMGPFPEAAPSLWNPVLLERFFEIEWSLVIGNANGMGTIVMLSGISLMLTVSGLSLVQRENISVNKELSVAGLANAVCGLSGGLVALPSLSMSNLVITVGAPKSRLVGLVVALFCALALFFAMDAIAWFPKPVLAGLLMYLGWSFLERWLIEARTQLPRLEYGVVLVILLVVAVAGFLEGVFAGLICAILLFVVNYSKIDVVRYALTGTQRKSNVERHVLEEKYLRQHGGCSLILKLQGYLFFGTTAALNSRIEQRIANTELPPLRYVALDYAQVSGMDSSAALSFVKLSQEAAKSNFFLLLTGMPQEMQERLRGNWFESETSSYVQLLPDLDHGVEWIEEHMLAGQTLETEHLGIMQQITGFLPNPENREILEQYLEYRQVKQGDVLARQGESADELFLLESCSASVFLDIESGKMHRIRRAGSGTVFGEVGFYLGSPRTASVIIDTAGELYVLSQDANKKLEAEQPHIAAALHKYMIRVITRRLQLTTSTLQAVLT